MSLGRIPQRHTLLLSRWRPVLAWLPVESTIRSRQSGYYAAFAESEKAGTSEAFVQFMLEAIRDSIIPFAKQADKHNLDLSKALDFFKENPTGSVSLLAESLGCSERTAERLVAELKADGRLKRAGSTRAGFWVVGSDEKAGL